MAFKEDTHWRDTARQPRFFMIDARAAFPLIIFLVHIRLWTFGIAITFMIFFSLLEKFGFTLSVFFRFLKVFIAGPNKSSSPWWKD